MGPACRFSYCLNFVAEQFCFLFHQVNCSSLSDFWGSVSPHAYDTPNGQGISSVTPHTTSLNNIFCKIAVQDNSASGKRKVRACHLTPAELYSRSHKRNNNPNKTSSPNTSLLVFVPNLTVGGGFVALNPGPHPFSLQCQP